MQVQQQMLKTQYDKELALNIIMHSTDESDELNESQIIGPQLLYPVF